MRRRMNFTRSDITLTVAAPALMALSLARLVLTVLVGDGD
jgi:hypothetical protein